jgi:hypothetical protein
MTALDDHGNQNPSRASASSSKQMRDGDREGEIPRPRSWDEVKDADIPRGWQPPPPRGTRPTVTRVQMVALARMLAAVRLPKKGSTAKAGAARRAGVGTAAAVRTRKEKGTVGTRVLSARGAPAASASASTRAALPPSAASKRPAASTGPAGTTTTRSASKQPRMEAGGTRQAPR